MQIVTSNTHIQIHINGPPPPNMFNPYSDSILIFFEAGAAAFGTVT